MGGKGKGMLARFPFQGGPISPDRRTPEAEAQIDSSSSEDDVRAKGHVSRRDRVTREYVEEHGRYPWERRRRGRMIHDGAGSSAAGPVNQFHPQEYYHQSPAQQHHHQSAAQQHHHQSAAQEYYHQSPAQQHHQQSPQQQQVHHSPMQEMPDDGPLLRDMHLHISSRILTEPRAPKTLTVHNHGSKIPRDLARYTAALLGRVRQTQLQPLLESFHTTCDNPLLTAFVERWHADTSSFHLPFGEMTVTLQDVCNLLHLPIMGSYPTPESVSGERAVQLAMECFGATFEEAFENTIQGPYYRFTWLQELLARHTGEGGDEDIALRAYLLMLLSYSIFTTKTSNRAEAKWLLLLRDLDRCGDLAWGVGTLVNLYKELTYSSLKDTKHLSGFPGLLQAWIMWYFPRVWERKRGVVIGQPLGGHWSKKKTNQDVVQCRRMVDRLTTGDVCWEPFRGHANERELEGFSLYRGWLRWGEQTVPYMPDRCMRQFGYTQPIPQAPLRRPYPSHTEIMQGMADFVPVVTEVLTGVVAWTYPGEVAHGYLHWYIEHSFPRLMGDDVEDDEEDDGDVPDQRQQ